MIARGPTMPVPQGGGAAAGVTPHPVSVVSIGDIGNINASERVLKWVTIAGATLNTNGKYLRFKAWGTTGANANTKTLRVRVGTVTLTGTIVFSIAGAYNALPWTIEFIIARQNTDVQLTNGDWMNTSNAHSQRGNTALDDDANILVELTGQSSAAAANDIICTGMVAELVEAA